MKIDAINSPILMSNYSSKEPAAPTSNGNASKTNAANKAEPVKEKPQTQEKDKLDREDIDQLTEQLNKFMNMLNADLQFEYHEETKRMIVRFVDQKENRVIKEFPPHELLDTLAAIRDNVGVLLDKRV